MSDLIESVVSSTVTPQAPAPAQPQGEVNAAPETTEANAQAGGQTQEGRKAYGDWRDQIPKNLWDKANRDQLPPKLGEYLEANLGARERLAELEQLSSKAIIPPEDGADSAAWESYWTKLGRPEAPTGYEFSRQEGEAGNPVMDEAMKAAYHKAGLSKAQGEQLFQEILALGRKQVAAYQEQKAQSAKQAEETLKTEWGREYDTKRDTVMKGIQKIFGPDTMARVVESGLANDPAFMKGLLSVGKAFQEDTFIEGQAGADTGRPGVNQYDWSKKGR